MQCHILIQKKTKTRNVQLVAGGKNHKELRNKLGENLFEKLSVWGVSMAQTVDRGTEGLSDAGEESGQVANFCKVQIREALQRVILTQKTQNATNSCLCVILFTLDLKKTELRDFFEYSTSLNVDFENSGV